MKLSINGTEYERRATGWHRLGDSHVFDHPLMSGVFCAVLDHAAAVTAERDALEKDAADLRAKLAEVTAERYEARAELSKATDTALKHYPPDWATDGRLVSMIANIARYRDSNVQAVLDTLSTNYVKVCEGGAAENVYRSLAVSVANLNAKLAEAVKDLDEARADLSTMTADRNGWRKGEYSVAAKLTAAESALKVAREERDAEAKACDEARIAWGIVSEGQPLNPEQGPMSAWCVKHDSRRASAPKAGDAQSRGGGKLPDGARAEGLQPGAAAVESSGRKDSAPIAAAPVSSTPEPFRVGDDVEYFDGGNGTYEPSWVGNLGTIKEVGHLCSWVEFRDGRVLSLNNKNLRRVSPAPVAEDASLYARCERVWTREAQMTCAAEECSELAAVLCRRLIGKGTDADLLDEMADVEIMLAQLRRFYGDNAVDAAKARKTAKLETRVAALEALAARSKT